MLIIYCIYSYKHTKFSNRTKTSLLAHNELLLLPVLRFQLTNGYAIKCLLSITSNQYIIANKSIKTLITSSDVAAWPNRHCKKCYCMCAWELSNKHCTRRQYYYMHNYSIPPWLGILHHIYCFRIIDLK